MAEQTSSPWAGLDLDTAIRLRWALRDIKAKRTKLTPVSPSDLETLIEIGMVEMRDDLHPTHRLSSSSTRSMNALVERRG